MGIKKLTLEEAKQENFDYEYLDYIIQEAKKSKRYVVKIVWDEEGTPEHCFGYTQYSVRPYQVTDKCDGTRDNAAQICCYLMCKKLDIDINKVYLEAYPERKGVFLSKERFDLIFEREKDHIKIPRCTVNNLAYLARSMYDMNFRCFSEHLVLAWDKALGGNKVQEKFEDLLFSRR